VLAPASPANNRGQGEGDLFVLARNTGEHRPAKEILEAVNGIYSRDES